MNVKITDLDRRRAIYRLPEFKKDYAQYKKLKAEDKIAQFLVNFRKKWKYEIKEIVSADKVSKRRKDSQSVAVVRHIDDEPYVCVYKGKGKTPSILQGDSLYLKVTLKGKTETQLIEDFKKPIKPYPDYL